MQAHDFLGRHAGEARERVEILAVVDDPDLVQLAGRLGIINRGGCFQVADERSPGGVARPEHDEHRRRARDGVFDLGVHRNASSEGSRRRVRGADVAVEGTQQRPISDPSPRSHEDADTNEPGESGQSKVRRMWMPLFPLHVVLFPGALLPLHVFEERYRAMMRVVLDGEKRFGVVAIRAGAEVGGHAETYDVGCLASIDRVATHDDGRLELVAFGTERFRVTQRLEDDPYPQAEIETIGEPTGEGLASSEEAARAAFKVYLDALAAITGAEVPPDVTLPADHVVCSYAISAVLQVDLPIRQRLLEIEDAATRLKAIATIARDEAALLEAVGPPAGRPINPFSGN
jgi:uncharacterized protein